MTDDRLREILGPPQRGPCVICGDVDYPLSMGGPSICPSCDCGRPPDVGALRRRIAELEATIARLQEMLTISVETASLTYGVDPEEVLADLAKRAEEES